MDLLQMVLLTGLLLPALLVGCSAVVANADNAQQQCTWCHTQLFPEHLQLLLLLLRRLPAAAGLSVVPAAALFC
jgi:hypothetical protein